MLRVAFMNVTSFLQGKHYCPCGSKSATENTEKHRINMFMKILCPSVKLCGSIHLRYQQKPASPINCYLSFNVLARTSEGNASMFGTSSCRISGRSAIIFGKAICMARPRCFTAVYGLKVGGKVWFNRLNI